MTPPLKGRKDACEKIEREAVLLVGLLYHCKLTEVEYHDAILNTHRLGESIKT